MGSPGAHGRPPVKRGMGGVQSPTRPRGRDAATSFILVAPCSLDGPDRLRRVPKSTDWRLLKAFSSPHEVSASSARRGKGQRAHHPIDPPGPQPVQYARGSGQSVQKET
jgi:hypothetical protein